MVDVSGIATARSATAEARVQFPAAVAAALRDNGLRSPGWTRYLGAMQALLTVKILLNIHGQLDEEELLLLDFMNFSTLKIRRRAARWISARVRTSTWRQAAPGL